MSEQKESSVLFSLKELMNLEEDRIRSEEADRAAQAAAAERARQEAERQAREAEEARIRAEDERRRMEEARAREEAARLEAIRHAEVEKAKVEAEQKARIEAMAVQQQHERSLAQIKTDESRNSMRKILWAVAIGVPIVAGVSGFLIYKDYQRKQAEASALIAEQQRLADEKKKLEESMLKKQAEIDKLIGDLANAKDESTKLALQKQLEEARQAQQSMGRGGGGGPRPAGGGDSKPKPKCTPGDPLCSDL